MIANVKKIFFAPASGLNTDDADKVLAAIDYLGMENLKVGISQSGKGLEIQNIPSPVLIDTYADPEDTSVPHGTCVDYQTRRVFYVIPNETDSFIKCWDINAQVAYIVLLESQTEDGFNLLNQFRINYEMQVINGYLIFTDNNNEVWEINIEAGIKLNQPSYDTTVEPYTTPIPNTSLTLVKKTIIYPPTAEKVVNGEDYNYLSKNAFQFSCRLQYKNNQYSTPSSFSPLIPPNRKDEDTDGYNSITVTLPLENQIDDYVIAIEFLARYGNHGKTSIIQRFDKDNSLDAAAIAAHNAGTTALSTDFVNIGDYVPVDDTSANTESPLIPQKVMTLDAAKGRLFFSNYEAGMTTPASTTLTISTFDTGGLDDVIFKSNGAYKAGVTFFDKYKRKTGISRRKTAEIFIPDQTYLQTTGFIKKMTWFLTNLVDDIPEEAYYYCISLTKNLMYDFFVQFISNQVGYAKRNIDGTYDYSAVSFSETDTYAIAVDISSLTALGLGYNYNEGDVGRIYDDSVDVVVGNVLGQDGNKVLLTPKDIGAVGALYTGTMSAQTETLDEFYVIALTATAENPSAAITYADQTAGALDFPNARDSTDCMLTITDGESYIVQCDTNVVHLGKLRVTIVLSHPTLDSLNIEIAASYVDGVLVDSRPATIPAGYTQVFVCSYKVDGTQLISDGTVTFRIDKANSKFVELYTPHKDEGDALYYEATPIYNITDPGTLTREYETLSGDIFGDTYLIERNIYDMTYISEAMSPNDETWQFWERNLGWVNAIDTIGKRRVADNILYTDTILNGTKINALNWIQPLNRKFVGNSTGDINKIIIAGKQREIGEVMLIFTPSQPLSAYLGEIQLVAAAQNSGSPIQSTEVIGTVNALANANGTSNPESVKENDGQIFWFDVLTGTVNQYSTNGIIDVQRYKANMFFQKYSLDYRNRYSALRSYYVIIGIDKPSNRAMVLLPQVNEDDDVLLPSFGGTPPSYASSIKNRFDFFSNANKSFMFNYDYESNRWKETYEWIPEWMENLGSDSFSFKDGKMYAHNTANTVYNTFYGTQYPGRIIFAVNDSPSAVKDLMNIILEGDGTIPNFSVAYTKYPFEQITDIPASEWVDYEGSKLAYWQGDRLSPNVAGTAIDKLISGDVLNSNVIYIMLEFQVYDRHFAISGLNIGLEISSGNEQIIGK